MTPEQRKNYEQVNNVVEKYLADGVDMDLCQIRYYALKELCDTIREQESELKAGAGMLAKMHDKNFDLQKRITDLCAEIAALKSELERIKLSSMQEMDERDAWRRDAEKLKARLKPVEDVWQDYKVFDPETDWDSEIRGKIYDAIKSACEKEQPDETKK